MAELLFLSESEVDAALDLDELKAGLAEAFGAITRDRVDVPNRISANAGTGLLLAMPGYVADVGLATKLVTLYPDNRGLPSHQGILVFFDSETGTPKAVMGAERLTQARTSVGAALAADLLARADASTLAIIGGGTQAAGHLEAFSGIRDWDEIRIWNRTLSRAHAVAGDRPAVVVSDTLEMALAGADVIALCTHSEAPLFEAEEIGPGTHVSSVGIGREIPRSLIRSARVAVEWRGAAAASPPAGALDLAGLAPDDLIEIGEILSGSELGRRSGDEITVYKSVGHSAEDCAAARVVLESAMRAGIGTTLEL